MKTLGLIWRIVAKTLAFGIFGIGSFMTGFVLFPLIILLYRDPCNSSEIMRAIISRSFSAFVVFLRTLGLVRTKWEGKTDQLKSLEGKIVIANHPSLLDIVFLISQIVKADCIVKGALFRFPIIRFVVSRLYISNELDGEILLKECERSLGEGNTLVIFPEGTRTEGNSLGHLKRGAARLSIHTGRRCIPIKITCPDPLGLRKGDKFLSFRRDGPIEYTLKVCDAIVPLKTTNRGKALYSRKLTMVYRSILDSTSPNSEYCIN